MLNKITTICSLMLLALAPTMANASSAITGEKAPEFEFTDTNGTHHNITDFHGKNVVLEWTNHHCPFVIKHYDTRNMQTLQKESTDGGAIWISIVSSAEGKQGHITTEAANEIVTQNGAHPTYKILDEKGEIGKLYGASTTPHMFVIDAKGILAYQGAIDDNSSHKADAVKGANNHVRAALSDLNAGHAVKTATTKPYGCGVKY